jgi:hypothetical protein
MLVTRGDFRRKTNSWGRLPIGQSDNYATAYSSTGAESRAYFGRIDVPFHAKSKEYRKERRVRKRVQRGPKLPMATSPVLDDVDLDVEEALLTQMLLRRLDDDMRRG